MSVLQQALALAEAGVPVFPCRADKRPACRRGFHDATTELDAVRWLWRHHPGELIGVPTGAASGLDCLDLDPRHGAGAWWAEHKDRITPTRTHRTRSGGLHVLFRSDPAVRNSCAKLGPGVDTRGAGGYILWWPATGCEISDRPVAPWPAWLLGQLLARPEPPPRPAWTGSALDPSDAAQRAADRVLQRLEQAQPGTFHVSVRRAGWTLGGLLHALPFGESEAERRILDAIARAGATGLEAHAKTARWGLERGQTVPLDLGGANA